MSGMATSNRKRLSLFRRPAPSPLSQTDTAESSDSVPPKLLRKKERSFSWLSQLSNRSSDTDSETSGQRNPGRLRIHKRASVLQARVKEDFEEAIWSAASSQAPSFKWGEVGESHLGPVVHHGEVQTSSGIWRKTHEYLVLTENYLLRYKSQAKAAKAFPMVTPMRRHHARHSSSPAVGSISSLHSPLAPNPPSDDLADRSGRIELNRVVAVSNRFDARPFFALELYWVDDDTSEMRSLVLQLKDPESKESWLALLSKCTKNAATGNESFIHPRHLYRIHEYDVVSDVVNASAANVFIVVRHSTDKFAQPNSPAAMEKSTVNACLLAVGANRIHLLPLAGGRVQSFGLVTLFNMELAELDDSITFTFRAPLQPSEEVQVASIRSQDLVYCIYRQLKIIRPHWHIKLCSISAPPALRRRMSNEHGSESRGVAAFTRTLNAYLVGYGRSPDAVRYRVGPAGEEAMVFRLLNPDRRRYNHLELLALTRALYYSNCFGTISFAGVCLDELNLCYDDHGSEHIDNVLQRISKSSTEVFDMSHASLLTQEVAAIAGTNRCLRRLDFSNSIATDRIDGESESGILQALYPICTRELTNVEWLSLHGIRLSGPDLECLWLLADDKRSHLRGLDLSQTGISPQKLTHLFNALKEQENTFESLNLSNNGACLNQCSFDKQVRSLPYLRILDISHLAMSSEIQEPLIEASTFRLWRLRELHLSATPINDATVHSLCLYLQDQNSTSLRVLRLDSTGIGGDAIAAMMRSMTDVPGKARDLSLFVGGNPLHRCHEAFRIAIEGGLSPSFLSISKTEYQEQSALCALFDAIGRNTTTRALEMAQIRLFASAHLSETTLGAIQRAFSKNKVIDSVDLSGNYCDPPNSEGELNPGIKHALIGLATHHNLKLVNFNNQKLYYEGAFFLAEIIRNNPGLVEIHCEHSNITLGGFDELLKAIKQHTSLQHISDMEDSKVADLDELEESIFKTKLDAAPSKAKQVFSGVEGKLSGKRPGKSKRPSLSAVWERHSDDEITIRNWEGKQALLREYLDRNVCIARGETADGDITHPPSISSSVVGLEKLRTDSGHSEQRLILKTISDDLKPGERDGIETKSNNWTTASNDGNDSDGLFIKNSGV